MPTRIAFPLGVVVAASGLGLGAPDTDGGQAAQVPDVPSFARDLPSIRTGEPILQFNGKDLTGFYTFLRRRGHEDPLKVFTVRDGLLVISGQEFGGLTTRDEFQNYHLITEWKWGERTWAPRKNNTRDSGILVHCVGPDGAAGGNWMQDRKSTRLNSSHL